MIKMYAYSPQTYVMEPTMNRFLICLCALSFVFAAPSSVDAFPPKPKIKKPKIKLGKGKPAAPKAAKMDAGSKRNLDSAQKSVAKLKDEPKYLEAIPPKFNNRVTNFFTDYRNNLKNAIKSYEKIKPAFQSSPDAVAVKERIESAKEYIAVAGKNFDDAVANKKKNAELRNLGQLASNAFERINKKSVYLHTYRRFLKEGPYADDDKGIEYLDTAKVEKMRGHAASLSANCTDEFDDKGTKHKLAHAFLSDPDLEAACNVAKDFETVLKRGFNQYLIGQDKVSTAKVEKMTEKARKGSYYMKPGWAHEILFELSGKWAVDADVKDVRRFENKLQKLAEQIGVPIEGQVLPLKRVALKKLAETYLANASKSDMPEGANFSDKSVTKAAKKTFHKSVKVKKVKTSTKDWMYNKNALNIILSRYKMGFALLQGKGDKLCRIQPFKYQEARNNGKYKKAEGVWAEGSVFLVACK